MNSEKNTNIRIAFPSSLRKIRDTYGYSRPELAELTELNLSFIEMLENGKRNPSLKTIEKLATAYGMATWEFVKKLEDN
jgi:transcriptional regulator with XRE-family HTH domain